MIKNEIDPLNLSLFKGHRYVFNIWDDKLTGVVYQKLLITAVIKHAELQKSH
jgi:hypothetical protein